jgi:hypothetical protein
MVEIIRSLNLRAPAAQRWTKKIMNAPIAKIPIKR